MTGPATGWVSFEGQVEPLVWGRATYTILRLPDHVVRDLGRTRRVEGEIAEHPVNLALSRAPVVEGVFLWTGQNPGRADRHPSSPRPRRSGGP